jgi:hypothetical protein
MIHVIWQYVVKAEAVPEFERAYGSEGAWARLFKRYPGFTSTTLLRDAARPHVYLTIDTWQSRAERDAMLAVGAADYAALDAEFAGWTESETELGIFDVLRYDAG